MDGLRISELAERVGVAPSAVRYYERVGLVPPPGRSVSGYRLYGPDAEARMVFVTRGKRLGLSLEEIRDLLAIWDGTNCGPTQDRLAGLLAAKQVEVRNQIEELARFADQLAEVEARLGGTAVVDGCAPDLACCAPDVAPATVRVSLGPGRSAGTPVPAGDPLVIACTLTPGERPARLAEFAALAVRLSSWTRTETALRLRFPVRAGVEERLRALTAREQECCAFLSFNLARVGDDWAWDIEAPDDASASALDEFRPLLAPALESRTR